MKLLLAVLSFGLIHAAHAEDVLSQQYYTDLQKQTVSQAKMLLQLPWQVNDSADYKLRLGPLPGTMESIVREETQEGFWVQQDIDVTFQKQKVEILFDKHTGEILQLLVNGQKQDIPENNSEVIDMQDETVTVPAGTFDTLHVTIKDKDSGDVSHAWINPNVIPISGAAKQTSPSQFGEVVLELTEFVKH